MFVVAGKDVTFIFILSSLFFTGLSRFAGDLLGLSLAIWMEGTFLKELTFYLLNWMKFFYAFFRCGGDLVLLSGFRLF